MRCAQRSHSSNWRVMWQQVTRTYMFMVPAKEVVSICRSGCNHKEFQAEVVHRQVEWPGDQGYVRKLPATPWGMGID